MIDAYVEGRPIPSSSSVLTSEASVNRGGGCVKCCSGSDLEHAQELLGRELGQRGLGVLVGRVVAALVVDADEPVEHQGLAGGAQPVPSVSPEASPLAVASMSTPTWLKRASAIWVATVRCQIMV